MAVNVTSKRFRFFQINTWGDKEGQMREITPDEVFAAVNGNGQVWFTDDYLPRGQNPQRLEVETVQASTVERLWFRSEIAKLDTHEVTS